MFVTPVFVNNRADNNRLGRRKSTREIGGRVNTGVLIGKSPRTVVTVVEILG